MSGEDTEKILVGLTGGIACGKSVALNFFRDSGLGTVSTDLITHRLLSEDEMVKNALRKEYGDAVFSVEGTVDKRRLGHLIFSNPSKRRWLEEFLHPLIRSEWLNAVANLEENLVAVELPLLFENSLESEFDFVVSIFSNPKTQMHRLLAELHRGQGNNTQVKTRISFKKHNIHIHGMLDDVIENLNIQQKL